MAHTFDLLVSISNFHEVVILLETPMTIPKHIQLGTLHGRYAVEVLQMLFKRIPLRNLSLKTDHGDSHWHQGQGHLCLLFYHYFSRLARTKPSNILSFTTADVVRLTRVLSVAVNSISSSHWWHTRCSSVVFLFIVAHVFRKSSSSALTPDCVLLSWIIGRWDNTMWLRKASSHHLLIVL